MFVRPLLPSDTVAVWEAYRSQEHGADLYDDLATAWSLAEFDRRLLWRAGTVQHAAIGDGGAPLALGRLVELDFRNRAARFEFWRLAEPNPAVAADVVDVALEHAFTGLGLHRVSLLLPAYLVGADYGVVADRFAAEGTMAEHVFRRGRHWDVRAFAALEGIRR